MIFYSIPYDINKDIGKYYNAFMEKLSEDDYACFIDGDAMFTTNTFGTQLYDIVNKYKDVGYFTCYTNRVACKWQILDIVNKKNNDTEYHRNIGLKLQKEKYDQCTDVTNNKYLMSGVLILIRKSEWQSVGGFDENGMIGVDNNFHDKMKKHNYKLYRMDGVYVYHWYRNNIWKNHNHLLK